MYEIIKTNSWMLKKKKKTSLKGYFIQVLKNYFQSEWRHLRDASSINEIGNSTIALFSAIILIQIPLLPSQNYNYLSHWLLQSFLVLSDWRFIFLK